VAKVHGVIDGVSKILRQLAAAVVVAVMGAAAPKAPIQPPAPPTGACNSFITSAQYYGDGSFGATGSEKQVWINLNDGFKVQVGSGVSSSASDF
jgi:hypothetical protein